MEAASDTRLSGSNFTALAATMVFGLLLASCGSLSTQDSGPTRHVNLSHIPDAVPKHEPVTRAGNPGKYTVLGKTYYTKKSSAGHVERGIASWYGNKFHGKKTANGERYDMYAMTAAHKTLPIPSYVQVTNLDNNRSAVVRINDRGPFHDGRIIDLSYAAANKLGIAQNGTGRVEIRAIQPGERRPTDGPQPVPATLASSAPTPQVMPLQPVNTGTPQTAAPVLSRKEALYLQMGAFISRVNADKLRSQLVLSNIAKTHIHTSEVDRQTIYRVRIGPLQTVEEADRLASQIGGLGIGVPNIIID